MGSISLNHDYTAATFQNAVSLYSRIWRKRHGYGTPPPEVSHALSTTTDGVWHLACSETGEELAEIGNGVGILVEDIPQETHEKAQETSVEPLSQEIDADIPAHRYPAKREAKQAESKAVITTKRRRVFHVPE